MNRNLLLGWALLMSLFLIWTQYKTHQAKESLKLVEQQKADSLAQFNKTHPKVADTTSAASLTATPDSASSRRSPRWTATASSGCSPPTSPGRC